MKEPSALECDVAAIVQYWSRPESVSVKGGSEKVSGFGILFLASLILFFQVNLKYEAHETIWWVQL